MARHAQLRASDADRERVAERLRRAAAEGRLLTDELEQRLGAALSARTYGELDGLVHDLPEIGRRRRGIRDLPVPILVGAVLAIAVLVVAVIAFVLLAAGLLTVWAVWIAIAWAFFAGRRRGLETARPRRSTHWTRDRRVQASRFDYRL